MIPQATFTKGSDGPKGNAEYPWDEFDPASYFAHNYQDPRKEDLAVVEQVRNFFVQVHPDEHLAGVDVGPGANLYPALAMLPYCDEITLWEYSSSNRKWLTREIESGYPDTWDPFWDLLAEDELHALVIDPQARLAHVAHVIPGSVFDLPPARWDIGTMFFVAESISSKMSEFEAATQRFVLSLKPGAPFAAAFMENSDGYRVGEQPFPAVAITEVDVKQCLANLVDDTSFAKIPLSEKPVRDGYTGMILACGRRKRS